MKTLIILIVLVLNASVHFGQGAQSRFPVRAQDLWGYIDNNGTMVIAPKFFEAGQFVEGLAAVRLNGLYGYIDNSGNFIIPPKYDLAGDFQNGIAKVFIDGKPFFIDKKGNILFQHNFKSISSYGNHTYAIAITQSKKYGLINQHGILFTDTIFNLIQPFEDGLSVVEITRKPFAIKAGEDVDTTAVGVIDTTGKWIVEPGRYYTIENFKNGFAKAELPDEHDRSKRSHKEVVIDKTGKERFLIPEKKFEFDFDNEGYNDGVAVVTLFIKNPDKIKNMTSEKNEYMGVIDANGTVLFSDRKWKKLSAFASNRAFAEDDKNKWKLIDKTGKQIGDAVYNDIDYETVYNGEPGPTFRDGIAFVENADGWTTIDTDGNVLMKPVKMKEEYERAFRNGSMLFFRKDISTKNEDYSYCYGFLNSHNGFFVEPEFHDIDVNQVSNPIIYAMKDGKICYINQEGKLIWKEEEEKKKNESKTLNIDFMLRGHFYASSGTDEENTGHGSSENYFKSIPPGYPYGPGQLHLLINPLEKMKWGDYEAIKMVLVNTSADTIIFDAQDSRLYLNLQAKDRNGEWKDIEYLPNSWCGNSYHHVYLNPQKYWEFAAPVFAGEFKTKLRAKLQCTRTKDSLKDKIIYSNEIDGEVNPGQFWNKREYQPRGIMDPYNE